MAAAKTLCVPTYKVIVDGQEVKTGLDLGAAIALRKNIKIQSPRALVMVMLDRPEQPTVSHRAHPNLRQLRQLMRLDPASYQAAQVALRAGFVGTANEIARRGMHGILDRLAAAQRPASLVAPLRPKSPPRCDAYHRHSDPDGSHKLRCRRVARFRMTLRSGNEPYAVNRCQQCRDDLHAKISAGATFEILGEEAV